jgi:transcriptional regulator with XRE-family HTH domain
MAGRLESTHPVTTHREQQELRRRLGTRLRAFRLASGRTGQQLADALSWSQSKISKLETGNAGATLADVQAYLVSLGVGRHDTTETLRLFEDITAEITSWRVLLRSGIAGGQQDVAEIEKNTAVVRHLEAALVPGLLQTAEYARLMLTGGPSPADDVAAGVAARLSRQEVLYESDKHFSFLLMESALTRRVCDGKTMAIQIERVAQVATLANVDIHIIPADRRLPTVPLHNFRVFDDDLVVIELETNTVSLRAADDIAYYVRLYESLLTVADQGQAVRSKLTHLADWHRQV